MLVVLYQVHCFKSVNLEAIYKMVMSLPLKPENMRLSVQTTEGFTT